MSGPLTGAPLSLSIVVPVYQGEGTLEALVEELLPLTAAAGTPQGHPFRVQEVLLVCDGAKDRSAEVMQRLALKHPFVRTLWLSRNFGQHPATLAGMSSASGAWVVTLDEDGQHDPADIPRMLDVAIAEGAQVVYAEPKNSAPHGFWRNLTSAAVKKLFGRFHSYRLIQGEVARSLAAYCGNTVYLDVALSWVIARRAYATVHLRRERGRPSGYSGPRLLAHFWRLILTSGTGPLRFVSLLGTLSIVLSVLLSAFVLWQRITQRVPVQGWTSLVVFIAFYGGAILFALGVIAEYLGVAVSTAMGKPLYLLLSQPTPPPARPPAS